MNSFNQPSPKQNIQKEIKIEIMIYSEQERFINVQNSEFIYMLQSSTLIFHISALILTKVRRSKLIFYNIRPTSPMNRITPQVKE